MFRLGTDDASLEFPPGAVENETSVRYAIILHGPFEFPAGYRPASVVVYLNLGKSLLLQPIYLTLADWCHKNAHRDKKDLVFARAPHEGKAGKYQFSMHALQNTDFVSIDVLQIAESKCLYSKLLQEGCGLQERFCASAFHMMKEYSLDVRVLFTWFSETWIMVSFCSSYRSQLGSICVCAAIVIMYTCLLYQVLDEVYAKEKKWKEHPQVPPLAATFRINAAVETVLSSTRGPGWNAILDGVDVVSIPPPPPPCSTATTTTM